MRVKRQELKCVKGNARLSGSEFQLFESSSCHFDIGVHRIPATTTTTTISI